MSVGRRRIRRSQMAGMAGMRMAGMGPMGMGRVQITEQECVCAKRGVEMAEFTCILRRLCMATLFHL